VHSPFASPRATVARLKAFGLHTKKSFGQNFLVDDNVVGKIIKLAALSGTERVVEVGPGIGTLTLALLGTGSEVLAIERDDALLPSLAELSEHQPNLTVLHQDALSLPEELTAGTEPLALVANLPYQVAATIVLKYFQELPQLQFATVMVQREVAERMAARPGTKDYGSYSLKLALYAKAAGSFSVAPTSFLPPPRVDSTVIRLERLGEAEELAFAGVDKAALSAFIDASFAMRRKKLSNNLRAAYSQLTAERIVQALAELAISENARAEELELEQFIALYTLLRAA
jgi:16S rRNA (adenine1518-N6/adenine1519-N6)-dimethyltransferase